MTIVTGQRRLFAAVCFVLSACTASTAEEPPPATEADPTTVTIGDRAAPSTPVKSDQRLLAIPARDHAPERPEAGWCGETAIQEALLYYGAFLPQREINRAGKPRNPDLYWSDLPVALKGVNLAYRLWSNNGGLDAFMAWIRNEIDNHHPVLAGVKIYPTAHPQWGLDHFVLIVGYDDEALFMNTTWGRRERRTDADLAVIGEGFSFRNHRDRYYAFAIDGARQQPPGSLAVKLSVESETADRIEATVSVDGLTPGAEYLLARYAPGEPKPEWSKRFSAQSRQQTFAVSLDKARSAVFRCMTQ